MRCVVFSLLQQKAFAAMNPSSDAARSGSTSALEGTVYQDRHGNQTQLERPKAEGKDRDLAVEMLRAREMHRSLRHKEQLEGKLERVQRRLDKARRALARKTMRKTRETMELERGGQLGGHSSRNAAPASTARMDTARQRYLAENGGLASWRKPHLEEYTFNSPVVHSLLSHGLHAKHRFETEKNRSSKYTQIGNADAKKLKILGHISDGGHHGVVKSDFVNFAEERIIFDRMMKPARVRARLG